MRLITHMFKSFDFLGPSINFTIKESPNFKSVVGGFLSLIIYILYLFFFGLFGKDMIYKLNPTVSSESLKPDTIENYTITNETFFAFRFEDSEDRPQNISNMLSYAFSLDTKDNMISTNTTSIYLNLTSCNNTQFASDIRNNHMKPEEWIFINFENVYNKTLIRSVNSPQNTVLTFEIYICDYDDNNVRKNCKDFRKVRNFLSKKKILLSFLYHEVIFNPNNYTNPLTKRLNKYSENIGLNLQIINKAFIHKSTLEQDEAILFANEDIISNIYGISRIQRNSGFRTDDELQYYYYNSTDYDSYFSIYFCEFNYEQNYTKHKRTYMKIQDVFGNVNGFMDFLILLLSVINYYTEYRFDYYLFNELVNVRGNKKDSNKININYIKVSNNYDLKSKKIELASINSKMNSNLDVVNQYNNKNEANEISKDIPHPINDLNSPNKRNDNNQISFVSQPITDNRLIDSEGLTSRINLFESNLNNDANKRIPQDNLVKDYENKNVELQGNDLEIKKH